ncbi:MAG: FISUMP domain-containing protein [Patescibacteria group bacterium]
MKNSSTKKFFTLIELLITIAIIAVITSISLISFSNVRQKGRDTQRLSDIKLIQKALEDYYRDEGTYPVSLTPGGSLIGSSSNTVYMRNIPQNPSPRSDGNCPDDNYSYELRDTGYFIDFCLSESNIQASAGEKCATAQGILNTTCPFSCGDTLIDSRDLKSYPTILIGTQCWIAQNINVGTMVTGVTAQTNNSIIEKYCYNNSESFCDTFGGFYQWDEAMQYTEVERAQGVCPSGWHIPTDSEQNILDQFLTVSPYTCNASRSGTWGCATAGTSIKDPNGFNAGLTGNRNPNGSFGNAGSFGFLWSSSINGTSAWFRYLNTTNAVSRAASDQSSGYSVHCLKD